MAELFSPPYTPSDSMVVGAWGAVNLDESDTLRIGFAERYVGNL